MIVELTKFIPWISAIAAVLCGVCGWRREWRWLAGPICVAGVVMGFALTLTALPAIGSHHAETVELMRWIGVGSMQSHFGYFLDPLTMVMLLVVTGIGSLIAIYAMGYMADDPGYARFFMAVSIFIFAMTTLVMADTLPLVFLGWEGVGLASYLLIGFYYRKPAAVEAAKKAFIVNRVGDLGFALGIFGAYVAFDTVSIPAIVEAARAMLDAVPAGELSGAGLEAYVAGQEASGALLTAIPFLLMLGAFGKSAQIPLFVWLPDAMEGPSPVSALIHAATMVTSGVYVIARLLPVFALSEYALPVVGVVGGVTAIVAAMIAMRQNDLKKVFAYSTVSQLGYMFMGVAAMAAFAGVFHLITHAFFKALLFLAAGNVMHALAGQLDLNKMSGLGKKMPVTKWLMFAGCLALAGFPLVSGFWSKDMIIAYTFDAGMAEGGMQIYLWLGAVGLITAFLTAYYAFRAWFRVFTGPEYWEMGSEHQRLPELLPHRGHQQPEAGVSTPPAEEGRHTSAELARDSEGLDPAATHAHEGHAHHEPHEMHWWPMNAPLAVLAIGAIFGGLLQFVGGEAGVHYGWIGSMIHGSTANTELASPHGHTAHPKYSFLGTGLDPHLGLMLVSGLIAILAIATAWYFHSYNRKAAEKAAAAFGGLGGAFRDKLYVDEVYQTVIVYPLRLLGHVFYVVDSLLINGLLYLIARTPVGLGIVLRPSQAGRLQGYGLGMALGLAAVALVTLLYVTLI
mgnify:CR=1 FL=1